MWFLTVIRSFGDGEKHPIEERTTKKSPSVLQIYSSLIIILIYIYMQQPRLSTTRKYMPLNWYDESRAKAAAASCSTVNLLFDEIEMWRPEIL